MSKVKRFACVSSPTGRTVHRFYAKRFVEGEKTACGILVQKGWPFWYRGRHPTYGDVFGTKCKRCERASV